MIVKQTLDYVCPSNVVVIRPPTIEGRSLSRFHTTHVTDTPMDWMSTTLKRIGLQQYIILLFRLVFRYHTHAIGYHQQPASLRASSAAACVLMQKEPIKLKHQKLCEISISNTLAPCVQSSEHIERLASLNQMINVDSQVADIARPG